MQPQLDFSQPQKLHPTYLLFAGARIFLRFIIPILLVIATITTDAGERLLSIKNLSQYGAFVIAGMLVLLALIMIFVWQSSRRVRWQIIGSELRCSKGIFIKTDIRIPTGRIHSINMSANFFEQIFGVATLSFDTAGGNKTGDIKIPMLKKSTADALRKEILTQKTSNTKATDVRRPTDSFAETGSAKISSSPASVATRKMCFRELLLHGVSNAQAFVVLAAIYGVFSQLAGMPLIGEQLNTLGKFAMQALLSLGASIIIALIGLSVVLMWAVSVLISILRFFDFKASRVGARIETVRGLLTHKEIGVDVERIQELQIRHPLLRRRFGYAEIKVKMASDFNSKKKSRGKKKQIEETTGIFLHPFIKENEVGDFLREILPEFSGALVETKPLPKAARQRSIVRYARSALCGLFGIYLAVGLILHFATVNVPSTFEIKGGNMSTLEIETSSIFMTVYILTAAIFLFILFVGYRDYKIRGLLISDDFTLLRRGVFCIRQSIIPRKKIQVARIKQNFFQKQASLATISVSTGHSRGAEEVLIDIAASDAEYFFGWVNGRRTREISN